MGVDNKQKAHSISSLKGSLTQQGFPDSQRATNSQSDWVSRANRLAPAMIQFCSYHHWRIDRGRGACEAFCFRKGPKLL